MEIAQVMTRIEDMNDVQYNLMLQVLYFGMFVCKNQMLCLMWAYCPNWYDDGLPIIIKKYLLTF